MQPGSTKAFLLEGLGVNQHLAARFDANGSNIFQQRTFSDSFAPRFVGVRGRGNITTKGDLLNGDKLYEIYGKGWAQGEGHTGANISFEATENWNYNSHGARLSFYTSPPGQATYSTPVERLRINDNGNVEVLSGNLDVNGAIYQRGLALHADYVFKPDYNIESIDKHAEFMWKNQHLKAIPKAIFDKSGQEIVEIGSHRRGIVEELETAHIYIEQLNKQIKALEKRLAMLELK